MSEKEKGAKAMKVEVTLAEHIKGGSYTNLARVFHNQTEFVLDALFLAPQTRKAEVHSRLILSPIHAKLLCAALGQNIAIYEKKFGEITPRKTEDEPGGILH